MSLENERASLNAGSGRKAERDQPMPKVYAPGRPIDELKSKAVPGSEGPPGY